MVSCRASYVRSQMRVRVKGVLVLVGNLRGGSGSAFKGSGVALIFCLDLIASEFGVERFRVAHVQCFWFSGFVLHLPNPICTLPPSYTLLVLEYATRVSTSTV